MDTSGRQLLDALSGLTEASDGGSAQACVQGANEVTAATDAHCRALKVRHGVPRACPRMPTHACARIDRCND